MNATTPFLIDVTDVARRFQIPVARVREMVSSNLIPHVILPDGTVRFELADLQDWLRWQTSPLPGKPML